MFPSWTRVFPRIVPRLDPLFAASSAVIRLARGRGATLVTAESLTGGLIGASLTAVPGSSSAYWGGFAVYSLDAKTRLLGVPASLLAAYGAVSRETAEAMARRALSVSGADIAVAVTGVAGPGGGTEENPVGTVWIAVANGVPDGSDGSADGPRISANRYSFSGSRRRVRAKTALSSLRLLAAQLDR